MARSKVAKMPARGLHVAHCNGIELQLQLHQKNQKNIVASSAVELRKQTTDKTRLDLDADTD